MLWIALARSCDTAPFNPADRAPSFEIAPTQSALQSINWRALQLSPRVCEMEQAALPEVRASVRLFAWSRALLNRVRGKCADQGGRGQVKTATLWVFHRLGLSSDSCSDE